MPAPICKYTVLFSKHKSQHLIVWYLTTDYSHLNYVGDFSKSQHSVFVCVCLYVCVGVRSWCVLVGAGGGCSVFLNHSPFVFKDPEPTHLD